MLMNTVVLFEDVRAISALLHGKNTHKNVNGGCPQTLGLPKFGFVAKIPTRKIRILGVFAISNKIS